jgi:hypothetical protein
VTNSTVPKKSLNNERNITYNICIIRTVYIPSNHDGSQITRNSRLVVRWMYCTLVSKYQIPNHLQYVRVGVQLNCGMHHSSCNTLPTPTQYPHLPHEIQYSSLPSTSKTPSFQFALQTSSPPNHLLHFHSHYHSAPPPFDSNNTYH